MGLGVQINIMYVFDNCIYTHTYDILLHSLRYFVIFKIILLMSLFIPYE